MVFFDVTQTERARHRSGLTRVSARLRDEWGPGITPVRWAKWDRAVKRTDWFFTCELFSEEERPGLTAWLRARPCRCAAVFHDAIPLKLPHITWPQSVARHPGYLKLLAEFDAVLAVSEASRRELVEFWRWQGVSPRATVSVLPLGADALRTPRGVPRVDAPGPVVLSIGILEPRKNQLFLLDVAETLWNADVSFTLHLVGRVNPHFGRPIVARIKSLQKRWPGRLAFHERGSDALLARLYARARATVFPTLAEGCGLPVIESLWHGVPCLCSDLPVIRENADGGGCEAIPMNQADAWAKVVRRILTDDTHWHALAEKAVTRKLPTWTEAVTVARAVCAN